MGKPLNKDAGGADDDFGPDLPLPILEELVAGETVVWVGYPTSRSPVAQSVFPEGLFGLFVIALAVGTLISVPLGMVRPALGRTLEPFAPFKRIVLVLFGAVFLTGGVQSLKNASRRWKAAGWTCYVLTERRAIVFGPNLGRLDVWSFLPSRLGSIEVHERPGGYGDVVFTTIPTSVKGVMQPVGFIGISNVRKVEELLRKTLRLERGAF
jgi:hypothetical protein